MAIDIVLRLDILRPGEEYGHGGDVQTEVQYNELIIWPVGSGTSKPTWTEVIAVGDIELDLIVRAAKKLKLEAELLKRAQVENPYLTSMNQLAWYVEFWQSIAGAAQSPTVKFQDAIDHYTAAKAAWLIIKTLDEAAVEAYDEVNTPAWPV